MGCASSAPVADEGPQPQSGAAPPQQSSVAAKQPSRTASSTAKGSKPAIKLLDEDLADIAAPGQVHEYYTFDQGGNLGALPMEGGDNARGPRGGLGSRLRPWVHVGLQIAPTPPPAGRVC